MYYQRFIFNFKFKLHDFKSIWKKIDERLFFVHIYNIVQIFIEKNQLKEVLFSPFVKTMVMW
jgi:hypothetical protein